MTCIWCRRSRLLFGLHTHVCIFTETSSGTLDIPIVNEQSPTTTREYQFLDASEGKALLVLTNVQESGNYSCFARTATEDKQNNVAIQLVQPNVSRK